MPIAYHRVREPGLKIHSATPAPYQGLQGQGQNGQLPHQAGDPSNNFQCSLFKDWLLRDKKLFDKHIVYYMKNMIIQSSSLKSKLERLSLYNEEVVVMSLVIVNMYLSMQGTLINFCNKRYMYKEATKGYNLTDKDQDISKQQYSERNTGTIGGDYLQFTTELWRPAVYGEMHMEE
eukprot:11328439-Ditylum_brightwellii.AAC.1